MLLFLNSSKPLRQYAIPFNDKHFLIDKLPTRPLQQIPHRYQPILAEYLLSLPVVEKSLENLLDVSAQLFRISHEGPSNLEDCHGVDNSDIAEHEGNKPVPEGTGKFLPARVR